MSAIPQLVPLQASARPLPRYVMPTLVRSQQRKPVGSEGVSGWDGRPQQAGRTSKDAWSSWAAPKEVSEPLRSWAFYRKHTERMLRQYLHASMQVCRSPELLDRSVGRGWVSSRRVKTFEDAVIFVLDIERCLKRMGQVDRLLLERVVMQEYTYLEAAKLMGLTERVLARRVPEALDRLTELLLASGLLKMADE